MRSLFGVVAILLSLVTASFPQQASSALPAGKKQLTIDDTLREPAGNAGVPQFVEWSPDGRHLSFVRTNSTDGRDELYSLDSATGHGRVLTDDYNPAEFYAARNREDIRRRLAMAAREM